MFRKGWRVPAVANIGGALALFIMPCCVSISSSGIDICQELSSAFTANNPRQPSPYAQDSLVFFLHMPRTAGRSFLSCFLKPGTQPKKRCPKAYDTISRLNVTVPQCQLLSSHDDLSLLSQLPANVAVMTHIRDPVDRFVSAYEFAIESALQKQLQISTGRPVSDFPHPDSVLTEQVWPWTHLIPFFVEDIKQRARTLLQEPQPGSDNSTLVCHADEKQVKLGQVRPRYPTERAAERRSLAPLDPYSNPLVMPLEEFARHPIAAELLHNGQTFQVLGITNNSYWRDAGRLRGCVWGVEGLRSQLMEVALARIASFVHVGTTDSLEDSVAAAAAALNMSLSDPAYIGDEDQGSEQAEHEGAQLDSSAQRQLMALSQKVRQARIETLALQKQLFERVGSGSQQPEMEVAAWRRDLDTARRQLRQAQGALEAARSRLPAAALHASLALEAGVPVLRQRDRDLWTLGGPLGVEYRQCMQRGLKRSAARRRDALARLSLPDGRSFRFGREARSALPEQLLHEIRSRNQMDAALFQAAEGLLVQRRRALAAAGALQRLPALKPAPLGAGKR